ncbi:hypothetical protein, partial [Flavobacterium chungangense]|uniref:hypothetical protein n=1 Tax=Flavobacterium chungangense TaxID=554283 RepID=UPI001C60A556
SAITFLTTKYEEVLFETKSISFENLQLVNPPKWIEKLDSRNIPSKMQSVKESSRASTFYKKNVFLKVQL